MKKIAVGIVLYNPELSVLKKNLMALKDKTDFIVLFDNSDKEIEDIDFDSNVKYVHEGSNKGIAYALNKIMTLAQEEGYEWVITYDQDSIISDTYFDSINKYIHMDNVAIFCPSVIDKRRKYMKLEKEKGISKEEFCITSASCTSVKAWQDVGGYDDWLFIDLVDNDFCKRLRINNWDIIRIKDEVLIQQFGNISAKPYYIEKMWLYLGKLLKNDNIAKLSYRKVVYPMRVYYTNRNIIYLNKKFEYYGGIGYSNYNCKSFFGFLICFSLASVVRGKNKVEILKAVFKGLKDGKEKQVSAIPGNTKE